MNSIQILAQNGVQFWMKETKNVKENCPEVKNTLLLKGDPVY